MVRGHPALVARGMHALRYGAHARSSDGPEVVSDASTLAPRRQDGYEAQPENASEPGEIFAEMLIKALRNFDIVQSTRSAV